MIGEGRGWNKRGADGWDISRVKGGLRRLSEVKAGRAESQQVAVVRCGWGETGRGEGRERRKSAVGGVRAGQAEVGKSGR